MSEPIVYQDHRGWKYRVMPGLGENMYKARFHKPDKPDNVCWHGCSKLPWRKTFGEAQADLDAYAKRKQMTIEQE